MENKGKTARKIYDKRYYERHLEQIKFNQKQYYQEHKKRMNFQMKQNRNTVKGHLRQVFNNIKQRCNNPVAHNYLRYGGRGIKLRFTINEFIDYVLNIFKIDPRGLTLHRINNDGHYELGNITFISKDEHKQLHKIRKRKDK